MGTLSVSIGENCIKVVKAETAELFKDVTNDELQRFERRKGPYAAVYR